MDTSFMGALSMLSTLSGHSEAFAIAILLAIGIFAGVSAGIFGIGGGIIIVPSLIFFLGLDIKYAIGVSIMQMVFSSLFGSFLNLKNHNINLAYGIVVGLGGACGASLSGYIVRYISSTLLLCIFICISLFMLYNLLRKKVTSPTLGLPKLNLKENLILFGAGALTGCFAITLGIGGGMLLTPLLAYYLKIDTKKSVGISLFFIIFSSVSGSLSLYRQGYIIPSYGVLMGVASIIGVTLGIYILRRIKLRLHKALLVCVYLASLGLTTSKLLESLA